MVYAVIAYAKLLAIPLVVSYHTHVPDYIPKYTWPGEKRKRGGESFLFFFPAGAASLVPAFPSELIFSLFSM